MKTMIKYVENHTHQEYDTTELLQEFLREEQMSVYKSDKKFISFEDWRDKMIRLNIFSIKEYAR